MVKFYIFLVFAVAIFSGCSNSSDATKPTANSDTATRTTTESISYEYDGQGCKTGKLHFTSLDAFCDALQGPDLSSKCSAGIRKYIFIKKCPGKTFNEPAKQTGPVIQEKTPTVADTPKTVADAPKAVPPIKIDEQQNPAEDKFTVGENAIITLVRAKSYDSDICDQTVFSGSFKDLYPKFLISNVSSAINKNLMSVNYGKMQINMITSGYVIASMEIDGRLPQLEKIRSHILSGTSQNIRLTESKQCAAKDPGLILVDLVMAPGVSTQKLDKDALIEVIKTDDQKKCVVVLRKTLGQLSQAKKPEADLEKAKLEYHIWDHARQKDSGELVRNRVYFSTNISEFSSSETFLKIVVPAELTNSLIDQLTQHEKPVRLIMSQECKGEKLDDPILLNEVIL